MGGRGIGCEVVALVFAVLRTQRRDGKLVFKYLKWRMAEEEIDPFHLYVQQGVHGV